MVLSDDLITKTQEKFKMVTVRQKEMLDQMDLSDIALYAFRRIEFDFPKGNRDEMINKFSDDSLAYYRYTLDHPNNN